MPLRVSGQPIKSRGRNQPFPALISGGHAIYSRQHVLSKRHGGATMPFYGEQTLVEEFIYRKLIAEIFRAVKGGRCEKCDLDHDPDDRSCTSCGDEIYPAVVYPIKISGSDIGFSGDDLE